MKNNLYTAGVFVALMVGVIVASCAIGLRYSYGQTVNFTDRNGSYAGSASTHGNQTSFTNSRGEFSGSAITHGNATNFYDKAGRLEGTSTRQGTASNPLTGGRR